MDQFAKRKIAEQNFMDVSLASNAELGKGELN